MFYKYFAALFIFLITIPVSAQNNKKINFSFFAYNGYMAKNYDFVMKSNKKWNDYISGMGGQLTLLGGGFAKTQFEMDLRYVTTFSNPNVSYFTLRQLYIQVPFTDYVFLTIGKREKKFGLAEFHNFSNRISPKINVLGHMEKLQRQAPGLIQLDWIASSDISTAVFLWSNPSQKWKYANIGALTELQFNNFYSGIYFYYERLKFWLVGFNISQQMSSLRLYSEGIVKEHDEQYYAQLFNFKNKGIQLSISTGIDYEWKYYSATLEYAFRSEGFNGSERSKIENLVKNTGNILGYNQNYYGKDYLGFNFGASRFFSPKLGFNISNLISLDSLGGQLEIGLSYLHREKVAFGIDAVYNYGKKNSEYMLYSPYQFQTTVFASLSF